MIVNSLFAVATGLLIWWGIAASQYEAEQIRNCEVAGGKRIKAAGADNRICIRKEIVIEVKP